MKNILSILTLLLVSNLIYSQENKALYKIYSRTTGVGFDEIEFFSDSTFIQNGAGGLATSIIDRGTYEQINDTIFLTLTFPRVMNYVDTFINPGHYDFRSDTLYIIDSLSFCRKKNCLNPEYKKIEERYPNGMLRKSYQWSTKEGLINDGNISYHYWDIFIAEGVWIEYYQNGYVKSIIEYKDDLKNGVEIEFDHRGRMKIRGQWIASKKVGEWIYFNDYRLKRIENYKQVTKNKRH
jgi:hypothetical protein